MSVIRGLLHRSPPEERSISYQAVFGAGGDVSTFGVNVNARAVQLTAVQACWRLVGESVASLPVHTYRKSNGVPERVTDPPLVDSPSEILSRDEWVYAFITSLMSDGNAFGLPRHRNRDTGWPSKLEWLPPEQVEVTGAWDAPVYLWQGQPFPEIVHVRGMVIPGQARGLSPLRAAMRAVETGIAAEKFGYGFFKDSGHPSAVLSSDQPITQEQAETIKARFSASQKGREPFVAGAGLSYAPMQVAPEESQFLETQKFTVSQIARVYGVPPEMIGGDSGGSLTYANVEQRAIDFAQYTLRPSVTRLERVLTSQIPRPQFVKLNLDAIIRSDTLARFQVHEIALRSGIKTQNEVRALEDLAPVDGADTLRVSPTSQPSNITRSQ